MSFCFLNILGQGQKCEMAVVTEILIARSLLGCKQSRFSYSYTCPSLFVSQCVSTKRSGCSSSRHILLQIIYSLVCLLIFKLLKKIIFTASRVTLLRKCK